MTSLHRTIKLNGKSREVASVTLADVLGELGFGEAKVATAVNGAFVPVAQRDATPLRDGDRVEVVSARQGG